MLLNDSAYARQLMRGLALLLIFSLSSCAPVQAPMLRQDAAERIGLNGPEAGKVAQAQSLTASTAWSDDPILSELLRLARIQNLDLSAARARVTQVRAEAHLVHQQGMPQTTIQAASNRRQLSAVDADPYAQGNAAPPAQNVLQLGVVASWEVDLFGRVGTAAAVAERIIDAEAARLAAAEALLEAELVRLYARYRERASAERSLAISVLVAEQRSHDLATRAKAGLSEPPEQWQAEAMLAALRAEHVAATHETRAATQQILVLLGESPLQPSRAKSLLDEPGDVPEPPSAESLNLPTDFLSRRPDVLIAEAELRASIGQVTLAERANWPSLNVLGVLATLALPGSLGEAATRSSTIGPQLQWNWLDFGRARMREAAARAGQEAAAARFEASVLEAVADADRAAQNWLTAVKAWQAARTAADSATQAWRRTQMRADIGLEPRMEASSERLATLLAERNLLHAKAQAVSAYAAWNLALGVAENQPESSKPVMWRAVSSPN